MSASGELAHDMRMQCTSELESSPDGVRAGAGSIPPAADPGSLNHLASLLDSLSMDSKVTSRFCHASDGPLASFKSLPACTESPHADDLLDAKTAAAFFWISSQLISTSLVFNPRVSQTGNK